MLKLAADLLSHPWLLTDADDADLKVYCFDYPEGLSAWQSRTETGLSALLASHGNVTEAVDIIIKKPLRTANFSEALNLIDEQIRNPQPRKVVSLKISQTAPDKKPATAEKLFFWTRQLQKQLLPL